MSDIACAYLKSYLADRWCDEHPNDNGLPILSCVLLHLTVSRYGDILLAGIQQPYKRTDVTQVDVLMMLYNLTRTMEASVIRWIVGVSELCMAALVLGTMVALSHVLNVTVVFGLYLVLTAVALRFRAPVKSAIARFIRTHSYSRLLYNIHLR